MVIVLAIAVIYLAWKVKNRKKHQDPDKSSSRTMALTLNTRVNSDRKSNTYSDQLSIHQESPAIGSVDHEYQEIGMSNQASCQNNAVNDYPATPGHHTQGASESLCEHDPNGTDNEEAVVETLQVPEYAVPHKKEKELPTGSNLYDATVIVENELY